MSGTDVSPSSALDGVPTYVAAGDPDPRFADYYPAWLGKLADDVTVDDSLLDGAALGPEAARAIIGTIRGLYEHQQFSFTGPFGDNSWLEVYTSEVRGQPIGCAVLMRSTSSPARRDRTLRGAISRLLLCATEAGGAPTRAPAGGAPAADAAGRR